MIDEQTIFIALKKQLIYKYKLISGICLGKWNDNSIVQLTSNFVTIHPIQNILRRNKFSQSREVECHNIAMQHNKSMGGVDMLLALYRITIKTRRWYVKVLWHLA